MRQRILRREMWNLAGVPVVMSKWMPFAEEIQQETKSVPLWVHLRKVPMNMFSWKGLSFVTSPVGVPKRLHPETAQCVDFKIAKVFVEAVLTKELPRALKFKFQGKETRIEYSYLWLPSKYVESGKEGNRKENENLSENDKGDKEKEGEEVVGKTHEVGDIILNSTVDVEVENVAVETKESEIQAENSKETISANIEEEWQTVSPGKVGRSAEKMNNTLEYGHVSILANSRFSVLRMEEEEEEEGEITEKVDHVVKTREVGTSDIVSGERTETELESVAEDSDHLKDTAMESGGEETLDDDLSKEADVGNKEKETMFAEDSFDAYGPYYANHSTTFIFTNCENLEQAAKEDISSYAQRKCQLLSYARKRYNGGLVSEALFSTCFPGCEVPSWFCYETVGSELEVKLLPHWHDKRLAGIALCAVVSFHDCHDQISRLSVTCTFKVKVEDESWVPFTCPVGSWTKHGDKIESDHVFIGYTSCPCTIKFPEDENSDKCTYTEASLEFTVAGGTNEKGKLKVLKCGLGLVYAKDKSKNSCHEAKYDLPVGASFQETSKEVDGEGAKKRKKTRGDDGRPKKKKKSRRDDNIPCQSNSDARSKDSSVVRHMVENLQAADESVPS
ncbi:hypothetical protein Bca4012_043065 [Brassica carinata]